MSEWKLVTSLMINQNLTGLGVGKYGSQRRGKEQWQ